MGRLRHSVLALGLVVCAVAPLRADDAKEARAIVDKAIKAHGGAENVKKYPASVSAFKGTFYGMGMELPMSGELSIAGESKLKMRLELEAGGMAFTIQTVVNGDKGWTKVGDNDMELSEDQLAEVKANQHAGWVVSLVPLIDGKGYTLTTTGEHEVGEKKAVGVKVTAKGKRDVELYFDKESGRLVKSAHTVKDETSGQEVLEESLYSEYKEVQGVQQPTKLETRRDGNKYTVLTVSDVQLYEKLDDNVFDKP